MKEYYALASRTFDTFNPNSPLKVTSRPLPPPSFPVYCLLSNNSMFSSIRRSVNVKKSYYDNIGVYSEEAHKNLKIIDLRSGTIEVITEFFCVLLLM
jgi:hypothetical protein